MGHTGTDATAACRSLLASSASFFFFLLLQLPPDPSSASRPLSFLRSAVHGPGGQLANNAVPLTMMAKTYCQASGVPPQASSSMSKLVCPFRFRAALARPPSALAVAVALARDIVIAPGAATSMACARRHKRGRRRRAPKPSSATKSPVPLLGKEGGKLQLFSYTRTRAIDLAQRVNSIERPHYDGLCPWLQKY